MLFDETGLLAKWRAAESLMLFDDSKVRMTMKKQHIAFGRCGRPKRAFWIPKNSTFFKSG